MKNYIEFVNDLLFREPKRLEVHVIAESMTEENIKMKAENKEEIIYSDTIDGIKRKMPLYQDYFSFMK